MNNNHWRPPHPGHFPHPQVNQQVQFCRDCGQYHPIPPQQGFPRQPEFPQQNPQQINMQQAEHPAFQQAGPEFEQQDFRQPEPESHMQQRQPEPEVPAEQPQFNRQYVEEEQQMEPHQNFQQPEQQPEWRRINMIEAINIALEQVPGEPVEAELKQGQGMLIYEVEIVNQQGVKYEVEIDVNTGNVLSVELD